jgi:hypothetical protein
MPRSLTADALTELEGGAGGWCRGYLIRHGDTNIVVSASIGFWEYNLWMPIFFIM